MQWAQGSLPHTPSNLTVSGLDEGGGLPPRLSPEGLHGEVSGGRYCVKGWAGEEPNSPEELCCEVFEVVFSELELGFDLLQLRFHILHRWGRQRSCHSLV